jgi:hypothetical protein
LKHASSMPPNIRSFDRGEELASDPPLKMTRSKVSL